MKILVQDGAMLADSIGCQLVGEGHEVWATGNPNRLAAKYGVKMIPYQDNFANVLDVKWDLVVGCTNRFSLAGYADAFRAKGIPTLAPTSWGLGPELDKNVGRQIFMEAGLHNPSFCRYDSSKAAAIDLRNHAFTTESVVVKFLYDEVLRTRVFDRQEDAALLLEHVADQPVLIESKIEGVEFAVAGFYDGKTFVPSLPSIEHKHLWPNRRGVLTGEMGTLVISDAQPRWVEMFEACFATRTAKECFAGHYRGWIDINTIVDYHGNIFPLEFTCRWGIPQQVINSPMFVGGTFGEFLLSVANGEARPDLLKHRPGFSVGVNCQMSNYPYGPPFPETQQENVVIRGLDTVDTHIGTGLNVGFDSAGRWSTSSQWVMCITGQGDTVAEARIHAYRNVKKIQFSGKIYRDDIGLTWEDDAPLLARHGLVDSKWLA